MKTLFTHTNIAKFVLATGDRDFIPLVNSIRQQGKEVIIIGVGGAASSHLAQSADEFIFYETLVGKKPAGELDADQPRAKMPEKGREQPDSEGEPETRREKEPASAPPDVYDVLVQAIHLARERGYVCSFGSLKLLMKELMGGEFKENRYKDASGRPFAKFKDFVIEAERRGKVQVFTSGTVNEVFLPGEDPYKLSLFAQDLKEEPSIPAPEAQSAEVRVDTRPGATNGRRRRRRARGGQRPIVPLGEADQVDELLDDVAAEDLDDSDAVVGELPIDDSADELFETLVELVEDEQESIADLPSFEEVEQSLFEEVEQSLESVETDAESAELAQPLAEPVASEMLDSGDSGDPSVGPADVLRPFVEAEWSVLRDVVARFERPIAFNQIHNALREARNSAGINRTNEELRTLIKQAINTGMLTRSGKGSQIVYRLAPIDAPGASSEPGDTPDLVELIEGAEQPSGQPELEAPAATDQPEFYTPEAAAEAARAEQHAEDAGEISAADPVAEQPIVIAATDSALDEQAPSKPSRSRSRRKPPAPVAEAPIEVPAAEAAEAKPKRRRTKNAEAAVEAPAVEQPAKPKRTRRKKTEAVEESS
jgi:hypothetical protein